MNRLYGRVVLCELAAHSRVLNNSDPRTLFIHRAFWSLTAEMKHAFCPSF